MGRAARELKGKGGLDLKREKRIKKRTKSASAASFLACFILLHLSLVPVCQAAVSECLSCVAVSAEADVCSAENANSPDCVEFSKLDVTAADACRAGIAANIPKVACEAPSNHACDVTVQKMGGFTMLWRSCCFDGPSLTSLTSGPSMRMDASDIPPHPCQFDLHNYTNPRGVKVDADSCLTDNCNTMFSSSPSQSSSPSSAVMIKMFPGTTLLLVLLFTST